VIRLCVHGRVSESPPVRTQDALGEAHLPSAGHQSAEELAGAIRSAQETLQCAGSRERSYVFRSGIERLEGCHAHETEYPIHRCCRVRLEILGQDEQEPLTVKISEPALELFRVQSTVVVLPTNATETLDLASPFATVLPRQCVFE
jgi:hypothetical protein